MKQPCTQRKGDTSRGYSVHLWRNIYALQVKSSPACTDLTARRHAACMAVFMCSVVLLIRLQAGYS